MSKKLITNKYLGWITLETILSGNLTWQEDSDCLHLGVKDRERYKILACIEET